MRNWLTKLQPSPWLLRKLLMLAILVGVGVTAFFWGRRQHADAQSSGLPIDPKDSGAITDYSKRVVARLYNGQVPVTREESRRRRLDRMATSGYSSGDRV
jgi:hypothetical protein